MRYLPFFVINLLGVASIAPASTLLGSYNDRDWYLNDDPLSFADARAAAASAGGTLAAIHDAGDQAFLEGFLGGVLDSSRTYFIGGSDEISEGTFLWDDGSPFGYTKWGAPTEPNNFNDEDALAWNAHVAGGWNDVSIHEVQHSIYTVQSVPEPASLAAVGAGALALLRRRGRRLPPGKAMG